MLTMPSRKTADATRRTVPADPGATLPAVRSRIETYKRDLPANPAVRARPAPDKLPRPGGGPAGAHGTHARQRTQVELFVRLTFSLRRAGLATRLPVLSRKDSGMTNRIADTADVDERATIGAGTSVWHLAQVREDAVVGANCNVGRGVYIGPGVRIGDNVKLQNYALVYEPAQLADGVFIGPAVVLTNDEYPR